MAVEKHVLNQNSITVIQAYVPTGLGHLRVTYALYEGLPAEVEPILLGSQDRTLTFLHRITSMHAWGRKLMELSQNGKTENLVTKITRYIFRRSTSILYKQLITILDQRIIRPKLCVVVSTHFGLGHQLVSLKESLLKEKGIVLLVVIVVTDDSPQHMWYVEGADLTFVPSESTKESLLSYAQNEHLQEIPIVVSPYPVSPKLTHELHDSEFENRLKQCEVRSETPIHVSIPISGAAVWMDYYLKLIQELHRISDRLTFHVVSKVAPFTEQFLTDILPFPYIEKLTSSHDREVVDLYEKLYLQNTISLEVTKPSEQAFKALINPDQRGGSILLFSSPVGRQEYDNLNFMKRHKLLPDSKEQETLWRMSQNRDRLKDSKLKDEILASALKWRSLCLPQDPGRASRFIWWCLKEGIFSKMLQCRILADESTRHGRELGFDGVQKVWEQVENLVETKLLI